MDMSRKYSLILDAKPPAQFQGLQKNKSDYVKVNGSEILWGRPFGASLQVHQSGFCDGIHSLVHIARYFVQRPKPRLRSHYDNIINFTPVQTLAHVLSTAPCFEEYKVSNLTYVHREELEYEPSKKPFDRLLCLTRAYSSQF